MVIKELGIPIKNYSFKRRLKTEISPANFLTHNLYSYPAKFIPHVPYYVISKFLKGKDNSIVLDPFSGSSTTAVEALRLGHNSICIDINPFMNFLTKVKTQKIAFTLCEKSTKLDSFFAHSNLPSNKNNQIDLDTFFNSLHRNRRLYHPRWNNIDHWYPEEFKDILTKIWGFVYSLNTDVYPEDFIDLVKLTSLYLSRYLSFGARDVPKLFRSKRRTKQIEKMRIKFELNPNLPFEVFKNKLKHYFGQMDQLRLVLDKKNVSPEYEFELDPQKIKSSTDDRRKIVCLGGTDIATYNMPIFNESLDLIVTSPPYIYAQEYMRSTKLDLYWLNSVDDARIRHFTKKELGIKTEVDHEQIKSYLKNINSFNLIAKNLEEKEKRKYGKIGKYTLMTYNYFFDMYKILEKITLKLKKNGVFSLFIGNPTILGNQVPCHNIFSEFFQDIGLEIVEIGFDAIISPRLLKRRKNESPNGMQREWLIVTRKK